MSCEWLHVDTRCFSVCTWLYMYNVLHVLIHGQLRLTSWCFICLTCWCRSALTMQIARGCCGTGLIKSAAAAAPLDLEPQAPTPDTLTEHSYSVWWWYFFTAVTTLHGSSAVADICVKLLWCSNRMYRTSLPGSEELVKTSNNIWTFVIARP